MIKKNILFLLFGAFLLVSCGKQIPGDVIKPKKMEEILYEYHLGEAVRSVTPYNDDFKNEAYKELIFKKYGINKAVFDSSLVWYTKNPQELAKIYTNIGERFRDNNQKITNILAKRLKEKVNLSGKVVDVWNDNNLAWLTPSSLTNRIDFQIVADTTFKENDRFILNADYIFLSKGTQEAYAAINVIFDNDSITGSTQQIKHDGHFMVNINANGDHKIRSVNGFIYYKAKTPLLGLVVNNIKLIRIHNPQPIKPVVNTDTLSKDIPQNNSSLNETTVPVNTIDTSVNVPIQEEVPIENKGDQVRERFKQRKN